jgi:hypothetical protein
LGAGPLAAPKLSGSIGHVAVSVGACANHVPAQMGLSGRKPIGVEDDVPEMCAGDEHD